MNTTRIITLQLIGLLLLPCSGMAEGGVQQSTQQGGQRLQERGPSRVPPQVAIAVCKGKSEGTSCSMVVPSGETKTGACVYTPDNKYFACRPDDMPRQQPPLQQ